MRGRAGFYSGCGSGWVAGAMSFGGGGRTPLEQFALSLGHIRRP